METLKTWLPFLAAVGSALQVLMLWAFATGRFVGRLDRRHVKGSAPDGTEDRRWDVPTVGEQLRSLKSRMDTAGKELSELGGKCQKLVVDVPVLQREVASLERRVNHLEEKIDG